MKLRNVECGQLLERLTSRILSTRGWLLGPISRLREINVEHFVGSCLKAERMEGHQTWQPPYEIFSWCFNADLKFTTSQRPLICKTLVLFHLVNVQVLGLYLGTYDKYHLRTDIRAHSTLTYYIQVLVCYVTMYLSVVPQYSIVFLQLPTI